MKTHPALCAENDLRTKILILVLILTNVSGIIVNAVGLTAKDVELIYDEISRQGVPDSLSLCKIEQLGRDVKQVGEYVGHIRSGAKDFYGHRCAKMYEALAGEMKCQDLDSCRIYRHLLCDLGSYFKATYNNRKASKAWGELLRVIDLYEKNPQVKVAWQLMAANIEPYEMYDIVYTFESCGNRAQAIIQFVNNNSALADKRLELGLLFDAMESGIHLSFYLDNLDELYRRALQLVNDIYPDGAENSHIYELYYQLARISNSMNQNASDSPDDRVALQRATELLDSISVWHVKRRCAGILAMINSAFSREDVAQKLMNQVREMSNAAQAEIDSQIIHMEEFEVALSEISKNYNNQNYTEGLKQDIDKLISHTHNRDNSSLAAFMMYNYLINGYISIPGCQDLVTLLIDEYKQLEEAISTPDEKLIYFTDLAYWQQTRGKIAEAEKTMTTALEMAKTRKFSDRTLARANRVMGDMKKMIGKNNESLDFFLAATGIYERSSDMLDVDILLRLYHDILEIQVPENVLNNTQTRELAVSVIQKFNALSEKSVWGEYNGFASKVRFYELTLNTPPAKLSKQYEKELKNCVDKGDYNNAGFYCRVLGDLCIQAEDVPKAQSRYNDAVQYYAWCGNVNGMQDATFVLTNLYATIGDAAERRKCIHRFIETVENGVTNQNIGYLSFLNNQLNQELFVGNLTEARYLQEKLTMARAKLYELSKGDYGTQAIVNAACLQSLTHYFGMWYSMPQSDKQRAKADLENLRDIAEFSKIIYLRQFEKDARYYDLCIAHISARISLREEYESVREEVASLKKELRESGKFPYYVSNCTMWEFNMAGVYYNRWENMTEILDEMSLDDAPQNVNIAIMSNILLARAWDEAQKENYAQSEEYTRKRFDRVRSYVRSKYGTMNEDERIGLTESGIISPVDIYAYLLLSPSPSLCELAYDASLFYKNLLLEGSTRVRSAVYNTGDSAVIARYNNMIKVRSRLQSVIIQDESSRDEFMMLRDSVRHLEESIYDAVPAIGDMKIKREASWRDVQKALKDNQAAIEFVVNGLEYGALILRKGWKSPQYVRLLSDSQLVDIIGAGTMTHEEVRQIYGYPTRLKKNNKGLLLYQSLWEPLEQYLGGVERVYYCPSGRLSLIQFAAIETPSNEVLCEKYDLRLLSTTAELIGKKDTSKDKRRRRDVGLVGGVQYDADKSKAGVAMRNWVRLPGSLVECNVVDSICSRAGDVNVCFKKDGLDANEPWFRTLSGSSPRVLLLSTHGFYLSNAKACQNKFCQNKGLANDTVNNQFIQPLKRGGIILSDANPVWNDEVRRSDDCDGVLTASEIAELDLSQTDLVVLSACQTGQGEPTATEGINGLQRGFKLSGAGSIVMSMWEVNDRAGMKFMSEFFENLTAGMERHEAFNNAVHKLHSLYPKDPFMWAPFVMLD